MLQAIRYAFDESVMSLWRGRQSALLSILTSVVALFVLGGVLLATSNLRRLADEWSRAAEMSIYLADDITPAQREAIEGVLTPGEAVASHTFVSKEQALERFRETFADLASTVATLEGNPLPASIDVRLQPMGEDDAAVEALATRVRALPGVSDVRYDREWLDRLLAGIGVLRTLGLVLSGLLVLGAALTIANVVRLALYARRDEIAIMQLIGAPPAYVRGPFVMEGLLQGGLGALLAILALALVFSLVRTRYLDPLSSALNLSTIDFLSPGLSLLLVGGGMLVGCLGGLLASRRA
jgi:cell division transport system permease protein